MKTYGLNALTGEIIEREMTDEEIAELETIPVYEIPQMDFPPTEETKPE